MPFNFHKYRESFIIISFIIAMMLISIKAQAENGQLDYKSLLQKVQDKCQKDDSVILKEECGAESFGSVLVPEEDIENVKNEVTNCKSLDQEDLATCSRAISRYGGEFVRKFHDFRESFHNTPEFVPSEDCYQMNECLQPTRQKLLEEYSHYCTQAFNEEYLQGDCYKALSLSIDEQMMSILAQSMDAGETANLAYSF